jgi:hypothetical protein
MRNICEDQESSCTGSNIAMSMALQNSDIADQNNIIYISSSNVRPLKRPIGNDSTSLPERDLHTTMQKSVRNFVSTVYIGKNSLTVWSNWSGVCIGLQGAL